MGKKNKAPRKSFSETFSIYGRILRYLVVYKGMVIACIVASVFISVLHFASIGSVKPLGDVLFGDGSKELLSKLAHYGSWGQRLADFLQHYVFCDRLRALYIIMSVILFLMVIKNVLRFFQEYLTAYITERVNIDIANELYVKVQRQSVAAFSKQGAGEITAHFTNDITMMGKGVKSVFGKALREPLKAMGSLALALMINWYLTLIAIVVFPFAGIFINRLGKRVKRGAKKSLAKQANILSILQEAFTGIKLVKAYQIEEACQAKVRDEYRKLLRHKMKMHIADAATSPIMEVFVTVSGMGILMFSGYMVLNQQMTMGDFCAFYAALGTLFDPIRKLADLNNRINASVAAGERVFALMDRPPEIIERPQARPAPPLKERLSFEEVCFAYEPDKLVLDHISFQVSHGETVALVGPSGAGKTTLISLIPRFYDVTSGSIKLDGQDIRDLTLASLRAQIGLVTQEPFLFNDTIAANIAFGKQGASQEEIAQAAQLAHADEFIRELPQGYDTFYGEGGIGLSGGQKHRIALARAILRDPAILILDEAMANLDAESEDCIKKALARFTRNRTTFIIAHRFSTIEQADKIIVLSNGKLEGVGTAAEMMQASPTYCNLYRKQQESLEI